jgi:hypothetical protein
VCSAGCVGLGLAAWSLGGTAAGADSAVASAVPAPAAAAGYMTPTFGPAVTMGRNWRDFNFFGMHGMGGRQNGDGSVSIPGTEEAAICSAWQDNSKRNKWAGIAFGGGGYFEATFSFTGANTALLKAWPAWWAIDIENMSQNAVTALTQWPGQPSGYGNWIEPDFFEYNHRKTNEYGVQIHNWYGRFPHPDDVAAISNWSSGIRVPADFDWSKPHQYGFLWVPATASTRGYAQMYLDRVAVGPVVSWQQYNPLVTPPPPKVGSSAVSVMDTRHLALILSTGPENPVTVYAVSVWQASTANNLTQ